MRITSAQCISRSINETTQAALRKTSPQSTNARLVVITVRLCWQRWLTSSNSKSVCRFEYDK